MYRSCTTVGWSFSSVYSRNLLAVSLTTMNIVQKRPHLKSAPGTATGLKERLQTPGSSDTKRWSCSIAGLRGCTALSIDFYTEKSPSDAFYRAVNRNTVFLSGRVVKLVRAGGSRRDRIDRRCRLITKIQYYAAGNELGETIKDEDKNVSTLVHIISEVLIQFWTGLRFKMDFAL